MSNAAELLVFVFQTCAAVVEYTRVLIAVERKPLEIDRRRSW